MTRAKEPKKERGSDDELRLTKETLEDLDASEEEGQEVKGGAAREPTTSFRAEC